MRLEQESFRLLGESSEVRAGVRSLGSTDLGIEVLVRLRPPGSAFDPLAVRSILEKLERLLGRGYQLTTQDGWWVVCEKPVGVGELDPEERYALEVLADILDGARTEADSCHPASSPVQDTDGRCSDDDASQRPRH